MSSQTSPVPSWYSCEIELNGEPVSWQALFAGGTSSVLNSFMKADINCLVPHAKNVIFDESFADVERLNSLNNWFIGDSHGVSPSVV